MNYGCKAVTLYRDRDQDHPQEKEMQTKQNKQKKAKCLSEKALQITQKRREAKGREEKESYTYLNAEF